MGFADTGNSVLRVNNSLKRKKRRRFLDKKNEYPLNSNETLVNNIFIKDLEKENEVYLKNKQRLNTTSRLINRIAVLFFLGILLFGAYQIMVLYGI